MEVKRFLHDLKLRVEKSHLLRCLNLIDAKTDVILIIERIPDYH